MNPTVDSKRQEKQPDNFNIEKQKLTNVNKREKQTENK